MADKRKKTVKSTVAPKIVRREDTAVDGNGNGDAVAAKAYELFLARGGEHGHDVEDWLAAEAQLRS
ncbi:MAG TPA: DUF2934 domain-containing protein [Kofleriaceae bacterium]